MVTIRPTTKEAYDLFHEGSLALAEAEFNGIHVDRLYCERIIANSTRQNNLLTKQISETELGKIWTKKYGGRTNYNSDAQLREILFKEMGLKPSRQTSGGKSESNKKESVDAESLVDTGLTDAKLLIELRQLDKTCSYLKNIYEESNPDGKIHPFFNVTRSDYGDKGGARSYRTSSDSPNFQNFPKRHGASAKLVRRAIVPRPGHRIVGRDYDQAEVCVSACNHKDKNMLQYLEKGEDMHKDVSSMCFKLPPELCTKANKYGKDIRFVGKNSFTFAQFYFQEPVNSARGLWKAIGDMNLRHPLDPDKTIYQHLYDKGIRNWDIFQKHIEKVCEEFWTSLFPGYGKWRKKYIADYEKKGYIDYLDGFRVEGILTKYQLGNFCIQGPAAHMLLKGLIEVWKLWKSKPSWRSVIIGQIHDELTTDEHTDEFAENESVIPKIMTDGVMKAWDWIIVQLKVETSCSGIGGEGGNWFIKDAEALRGSEKIRTKNNS